MLSYCKNILCKNGLNSILYVNADIEYVVFLRLQLTFSVRNNEILGFQIYLLWHLVVEDKTELFKDYRAHGYEGSLLSYEII